MKWLSLLERPFSLLMSIVVECYQTSQPALIALSKEISYQITMTLKKPTVDFQFEDNTMKIFLYPFLKKITYKTKGTEHRNRNSSVKTRGIWDPDSQHTRTISRKDGSGKDGNHIQCQWEEVRLSPQNSERFRSVGLWMQGNVDIGAKNREVFLIFPFSNCIKCFHREGNGTPLQYSCLENSMDGGAW